ncbi:hypothetical protein [Chitinophaga filiformis]|uniref:Glycosyl transferase family 2 n=1 Tax=Chitinophaga filiformis TaxID=104663 RepID=A0ABY4HW78_CHIFI|nr:hypothetical protein [Chitinophaga filiformis]UPK68047.1 hypothetical protein MYF79_24145 [Chitinophaga filiformis]
MKKLALNFICKNESHIIETMLSSALPITDLIVAVDTGSTDNTIAIIKSWGNVHAIPTYVFERSFDDFASSRNFALDKLLEVVEHLCWNKQDIWGFWFDCDEEMKFVGDFNKDEINDDLYFVTGLSEDMAFSKQLFFNLSKPFHWEGPVHEYLQCTSEQVTVSHCNNIIMNYEMKGASWKTDIEKKYLFYVEKLKEYIARGHRTYRWLLYLADSYYAAAINCKDPVRERQWHLLAQKSYLEVAGLEGIERYEQCRLYNHIAANQMDLNEPWPLIKVNLLKAFRADKRFAEPIETIIEFYINMRQWNIAFIYSKFAVTQFHGRRPHGPGVADVKPSLYQWRLLYYHYTILMQIKRFSEAKAVYKAIKQNQIEHPDNFSEKDVQMIFVNSAFIIQFRSKIELSKKWIKSVIQKASKPIPLYLIPEV